MISERMVSQVENVRSLAFLRADRELDDVHRAERRRHAVPDLRHFRAEDDLPREPFVIPPVGQQFLSRPRARMGGGPCRGTGPPSAVPAASIGAGSAGRSQGGSSDLIRDVGWIRHHVEDTAGEFHDAQRMLEPLVGCRRIKQVGQRQLVDVPQPLERPRIQHRPLVRVQPDEDVNRVADLVEVLAHRAPRVAWAAASMACAGMS